MIDQDPFDDALRAAFRLSSEDEIDVWPKVKPQPWLWALPFAVAAASIAIAWQVAIPAPKPSWPISGQATSADLMSVR